MALSEKSKKIMVWGTVLAVGGLSAFLIGQLIKRFRKPDDTPPPPPSTDEIPVLDPVKQILGVSDAPKELNTVEKVKAFQDWMDTIGIWVLGADGKYKKLNKGAGYGNYGKSTKAAWKAYGERYLKETKGGTVAASAAAATTTSASVDTVKLTAQQKKDIDLIESYGTGEKSKPEYLIPTLKKFPSFVKNWAAAINSRRSTGNKNGTTFLFANGIYDSFEGVKQAPASIKGSSPSANAGAVIWMYPTKTSDGKEIPKGVSVGEVKGYIFNNEERRLYLYVPDVVYGYGQKWIYSKAVH